MRNVLAYADKIQRRIVSAWVGTAFARTTRPPPASSGARSPIRPGPRCPNLPPSWTDVLAYLGFPAQHRAKLHSTKPLESLHGEIKRRSDVVGIFPNKSAVIRLIRALLLEQNDEWAELAKVPSAKQVESQRRASSELAT